VQGAFRDSLLCSATQCHLIADGIPLAQAALAEPFSVGLHAVSRAGSLLGKRVLVSGCGPIGRAGRRGGARARCRRVVATDVVDEPLAVARALGAHQTINVASDGGWSSATRRQGHLRRDARMLGQRAGVARRLNVMRPRGTVVQLGLGGDVSLPQNLVVAKELSICGSFRFHAEFALAVRLINERRVDLSPVITRAFPMTEAREAFELASDRKRAMKVLIDFTQPA